MCLVLHTRAARRAGESETRLHLLSAWRDAPHFTERERAALAWTDALTGMDRRGSDEAYALVAAQFTPEEQVALNLLIGVINSFNRLNIAFAIEPPVATEDRHAA